MSDLKIFSEFGPLSGSVLGDDIIPFQRGIGDAAVYFYMTPDQLATFIGGGGSVEWGQIGGTLSNQTDLQAALNAKASLASPTFTGLVTAAALTVAATITGSITGNAGSVTVIPTLSGEVSNSGNSLTLHNDAVIGKVITGYVSGAGIIAATDTLLQAIQKLNGNTTLLAPLASPTFTGTVTLPDGQMVNGVTLTNGGSSSAFLRADGIYAVPSYPSTSPGGSNGQVQYNNAGAFGGFGSWNGSVLAVAGFVGQYSNAAGSAFINPDGSASFGGAGLVITNAGVITAANLSGTNTGNVTIGTANGLSLSGQVLSLGLGSSSAFGSVKVDGTTISASSGIISAINTGTVTAISVASSHGFAGSSSGGATPILTLSTSVTGLIKGDGTSISAATAGTDYQAPLTFSTGLTNTGGTVTVNTSQNINTLSNFTTDGFVKTVGGAGGLSIDTSLSTSGIPYSAGNGTIQYAVQTNNITAAGTDQGSATSLGTIAYGFYNVTTVTSGTGIRLSSGSGTRGKTLIFNNGTLPLQVYPNTSGIIDGNAANAAVTMAPGDVLYLNAWDTTTWRSSWSANLPVATRTGVQALTNKDLTSGTNTFPTFNQNTTGSAATLTTPRTIGGVSFNGSANITVATATGGFTVSGGDLALGANNLSLTGSIGSTGSRVLKGWFTDLQVTNSITGSITGNSATATALANGRTISITGDLAYTSPSFDGSGNITAAATLATVNGNVGSFTSANITVNAKGLITAASNGTPAFTPLPQTVVTGTSQAMTVNNGYIANNSALGTYTLPATATAGQLIQVIGMGTGGWIIAQNSGQSIITNTGTTTTGVSGSLSSSAQHDCVVLMCIITNTTWIVVSMVGNLTGV